MDNEELKVLKEINANLVNVSEQLAEIQRKFYAINTGMDRLEARRSAIESSVDNINYRSF